jgi:hypothetical protein
VVDGQEDFDGDNLTAVNETAEGTYIGSNDTDGDGLEDGAEVHEYGTNATLYDTDDDGLDNGAEIRLGTDPTDPDTDGNGTLDSNGVRTANSHFESQSNDSRAQVYLARRFYQISQLSLPSTLTGLSTAAGSLKEPSLSRTAVGSGPQGGRPIKAANLTNTDRFCS